MKTIQLIFVCLILTASDLFGQQIDSVKISVPQFFAMERMRRDYELLKTQFNESQNILDSRQSVINAQMNQIKALNDKHQAANKYRLTIEKQYRKKKRQVFVLKIAVPTALIGGVYLGINL